MDKRIRYLLFFFVTIFVLLVVNLTYLQVFSADKLINHQYNTRALTEELTTKRGSIITADGIEIAQSERSGSGKKYDRFYSAGEGFSHITGYYDSRLGRTALERTYNDELLGKDSADTVSDYIDRIVGRNQPGNDLILTIDSKIQRTAYQSLIGRRGSVVAINPKTGAVLALASYPGFNPNTLRKDWKKLIKDEDSPLLNRAINGTYPPGSAFKTVTLVAALANGKSKPEKMYPAPATITIHGGTVTNYKEKSFGQISLKEAFEKSINTVYGKVGVEVGGNDLVDQAKKFGFNKDIGFDLDVKKSTLKQASEMDDLEVAWTAVGQASTLATPFQMAMIAAGVANDGELMKPFMVEKVRDYQGKTVQKHRPQVMASVIDTLNAKTIRNIMKDVVEKGTGQAAKIENISVAGKTGTAEIKGKSPHAWFIAFAPVEDPEIAVSVIVENGGTGGAKAAPIARKLIETALK